MRSVDSTMPPWVASAPPVMPVPRPRGTTGTLRSRQMSRAIFTSSDERGMKTPTGKTW